MVDRELYLPEEWAKDEERRKQAGVSEQTGMCTKPELAKEMLRRALEGATLEDLAGGGRLRGGEGRGGTGPLRSEQLARMVPSHHPGSLRPRFPCCRSISRPGSPGFRKGGQKGHTNVSEFKRKRELSWR